MHAGRQTFERATSLTENPGKVNKGHHEKEQARYLEDNLKIGMIPNVKFCVFVDVAHGYRYTTTEDTVRAKSGK
jgi:hypothetical protein